MMVTFRRSVFFAVLFVLLLIPVGTALAASQCWYPGGNVVIICGVHNISYYGTISKSMSGASTGTTNNANHGLALLEVLIRLKDRCQNANGSWQAWNQFGSHGKAGFSAQSSGNASANGNYQNCIYGHQYRNESDHHFYDPPSSLDLWKYLNSSS